VRYEARGAASSLLPHLRSAFHKSIESAENVFDLAWVFKPVPIPLSVGLVAHHLRHSQYAEHGAHPLHPPANCMGG